jgi:hemerythrin
MFHETMLPELPATGHPELDSVHWRLAESLRSLWRALELGRREACMTGTVGLLNGLRADYTAEESLMRQNGYQGLQRHVAAHASLETQFAAIARRIRNSGSLLVPDEQVALRAELFRVTGEMATHVRIADVALALFLNAGEAAQRD